MGCTRALLLSLLTALAVLAQPALAADRVKVAAFQGTFINFPMYVAKDLKIFDKHGIDAELIYGKGIQVTNMVVSGATEFAGVAVEHAVILASKGQNLKLLVLNQTLPPFTIIVRKQVPTPNAEAPYPRMLTDLKGLKIGVSTVGASTDLTIRYLLTQAGLNPQGDVQIIPVGAPSTQVAALKNGVIDATIAFEPIQTEAVLGQKIARPILDIEGGKGPEIFREYAYNGIFVRKETLDARPDLARRFVAAIVEAEAAINDPGQIDAVTKVAVANMGMGAGILKQYIETYRAIFAPVATRTAIDNVSKFLVEEKSIPAPVSYEMLVADGFMPTSFPVR